MFKPRVLFIRHLVVGATVGFLAVSCAGGSTVPGGGSGTGGTSAAGASGAAGRGGTTGAAGTNGVAGTRGGAGTAGVTGTTGTAGTTGAGGTAAVCNSCKLEIQTYCQDGSSAQTINLYADVVNNSISALPLSQVTFRYWFTLGETSDPPALNIDYSVVTSADVTSQFVAVTPAVTGANEYLEVGYSAAAPTLPLFTDTGQLQLSLHSAGYSGSFDTGQTTDYSFQACAAGASPNAAPYANAPTITGYINGVLSWGTEPM